MSLLNTVRVSRLEDCLRIPYNNRWKIKQTKGDQRPTLVYWYLDCSPFADFTDLAEELYFLEETSVLDQVKRYVQTVPGMSCNVCISSVCEGV